MNELGERMAQYIQENPNLDRVVHLKADVDTRFSEVSKAMTVCRKAGASSVRLVADAKPETLFW